MEIKKKYKRHIPNFKPWNYKGIPNPGCLVCGIELSTRTSKRCQAHAYVKELNPSWKGGVSYDVYPIEFSFQLKEKIRTRDNFQCQNKECNMTEEEHLIVYGTRLEVHHIDYDKQNCDEANLISTCRQCNCRANYNKNYWVEYYQGIQKERMLNATI